MTDTERLDWMHEHYARFVSGIARLKREGGWEHHTTIRWCEPDLEKWVDCNDDGWREREFPGEFRDAIDAAAAGEPGKPKGTALGAFMMEAA